MGRPLPKNPTAAQLYRGFLKLRHGFPSRGVRTELRLSTKALFRVDQAVTARAQSAHGEQAGIRTTAQKLATAVEDYSKYSH